jgi:hypothetical protein
MSGATPEGLFYALRKLDQTTGGDDPSRDVKMMVLMEWNPTYAAAVPPSVVTLDFALGMFRQEVCIFCDYMK